MKIELKKMRKNSELLKEQTGDTEKEEGTEENEDSTEEKEEPKNAEEKPSKNVMVISVDILKKKKKNTKKAPRPRRSTSYCN